MIWRRITSTLSGVLAALALAHPVAADDTEIFVQVQPPSDPNVLIIIDTSGSMDSEIVASEDYDPAVTYPGLCVDDHVYYVRFVSGVLQLPTCSPESPRHVNLAAFRCQAALDAFVASGRYTDRYAQWNDDAAVLEWGDLTLAGSGSPTVGEDRLVDCRSDFGQHGDGVDAGKLYPTNGANGPWSSVVGNAIDWNLEDTYTFYSANYLNWVEANRETVVATRLQVAQNVARDLITSTGGLHLGLMRFSENSQGGMVVKAAGHLPEAKDELIAVLDAMQADGTTPLAETLYEAGQYYRGAAVDFGLTSTGNDGAPLPSEPGSQVDGTYVSPIVDQCQVSFNVLVTDGLPSNDTDADARIESLPGFAAATGSATCTDSCLDEMALYLANADLSGLPEPQHVKTYTIGFLIDQDLLLQTATALKPDGTPGYYAINDVAGLNSAFKEIIADISKQADLFTSPAITVDNFNRLTNRDELYFALFNPSGAPYWDGNVKKYRFAAKEGGDLLILDANNQPAVDSATGLFLASSQSFWSAAPDGGDTLEGGVRGRMTEVRSIYTDTQGQDQNVNLTSDVNRFHEDNASLTAALLGVDDAERDALIRLLRGVDESGNAEPLLGDSLHSVPAIVNYGGPVDDPDLTLYITTNDGYFHAVDPTPANDTDNLEQFAFIPHAMLPRLKSLRDNEVTNPVQKGYGLDGAISLWIKGDDGDSVVDAGEQAFVFFGMRRGGRNYYALDVSDRAAPRLAWTIEGGAPGDFQELGQSWSAPTVARISVGGAERTVLIFAGGYDLNQDTPGAPTDDAMGRAIYIVDAETGARLWWAANAADHPAADLPLAELRNSIPSDVRVVDTNLDGLADRLYVGDTGGRVFRFDMDNAEAVLADAITGGVIADLGSADAAGNRRFYYPPSVARVLDPRFGSFLTVSLGSGHRANPLGTDGLHVDDRFYMIRDPNVFRPLTDGMGNAVYDAVTEADLLDISNNVAPTVDALNDHSGWFLRLPDVGEKVLAPALTADNKIFFTSYLPDMGVVPTCDLAGVVGSGRFYTIELVSGAPVIYEEGLEPDPADRFEELARGGIPPAPVPIFTEPPCQGAECEGEGEEPPDEEGDESGCTNPFSQVTLLIATETRDPRICNAPRRTYWYQEDIDQ